MRRHYLYLILSLVFFSSGCQKRLPMVAPPKPTQREEQLTREKAIKRQEAVHHYNLGIIWKKTEIPEAIKEFNKALVLDPSFASAYFELGEIYDQQNQHEEAAKNFQRAFELDNQLYEALLKIAKMYEEDKDYKMALQLCEQVLNFYPDESKALALKQEIIDRQEMPPRLFSAGWQYLEKNEYQKALLTFEKVFKYDNQYLQAYWGIGETYRRLKDFPQAEKYFSQALKINKSYSRAHSGLGWIELSRDDEERAAQYFREALVKDENNTEAFEGLKLALAAMTEKVPQKYYKEGIRLIDQGKYSEAQSQFVRSLSFNQRFYQSIIGLGDIDQIQGDISSAEEKFSAALKIAPRDIDILLRLAKLFASMGRYEEAQKKFDEVLDLRPDLTEALAGKAEVEKKIDKAVGYYKTGKKLMLKYDSTTEAREEFSKALEEDPQFKDAWVGMGEALLREADYTSAKIYFQKALDLDFMYYPALLGLAKAEYYLEDYKQATYNLNLAEKVIPQSKDSQELRFLLSTTAQNTKLPAYDLIAKKAVINRADWAALLVKELEVNELVPVVKEMPIITDIEQIWARDYIIDVVNHDLLEVYQNHTFGPDKLVIHAELASYIEKILFVLDPDKFSSMKFAGTMSPFSDVSDQHVYFNAIMLATTSGIMTVNEDGKFNPEAKVSGEEALAIVTQLENLISQMTLSQLKGLN